MTQALSLQLLDASRRHASASQSSLEANVQAFLAGRDVYWDQLLEDPALWKVQLSESTVLENWQTFLSLACLSSLLNSHQSELSLKLSALVRHSWHSGSQYLKTLIALSQCFLGMPVPDLHLELLEGGAILLEKHEYCPWSALSYQPFHAEFGTLLCLLALKTHKQELQPLVKRLANWHLNLLDHQGLPVTGLFTQEVDGSLSRLLAWNILFFQAASYVTSDHQFSHIAKLQLDFLKQEAGRSSLSCSPLMLLIEKILERQERVALIGEVALSLPDRIYDPSMALVGYRSTDCYAACTLHGDHTGLGSFRLGDIQIVNYGPQYLPLADCQGFGIEGNHFTDHGVRQTHIQNDIKGFSLKGCVRLVDQPLSKPSPYSSIEVFRGLWLDIHQQLHEQSMQLNAAFLGFSGWEGVAMSFFVKAGECEVGELLKLRPRTLSRYDGPLQPILLKGQKNALNLLSLGSKPISMQVIPLGGGDNFWGADFLVTYLMDPEQRHYAWQMAPDL